MFRFIHSSDLHLGKRFGNFSGDLPGRLREARHAVLARLAQHAREHGVTTILLAGDTFDTETPAPDIRRQALAEMRLHAPIRWVILPGNHDSLQAAQLWGSLRAEAPDNVTLAVEPQPIALSEAAVLLPAPCTTRRPGRDLSAWMDDAPTPDHAIRIGLAHGPIQSFSEDAAATDVIAPDRARRAGLDYMALGDWHGALQIDLRTHYSGAPEPDRFKHDRAGEALLVSIAGRSAMPETRPLKTAIFLWRRLDLHLLGQDDPGAALATALPRENRRNALVQIAAAGHLDLARRAALLDAVSRATPEFAFLELNELGLRLDCGVGDLDSIDRAGALRDAANHLLAASADDGHSSEQRDIARLALARLYTYAQETGR